LREKEFIHCVLISCEENNGAGKRRVRKMMMRVRGRWGKWWYGWGVGEGKNGEGEGQVRKRMVWGRGGGREGWFEGGAVEGNFFRVEGRVREHSYSCLPARVSTQY